MAEEVILFYLLLIFSFLIIFILEWFYCSTLFNALKRCRPENRHINPWYVWLLLVPLVANFILPVTSPEQYFACITGDNIHISSYLLLSLPGLIFAFCHLFIVMRLYSSFNTELYGKRSKRKNLFTKYYGIILSACIVLSCIFYFFVSKTNTPSLFMIADNVFAPPKRSPILVSFSIAYSIIVYTVAILYWKNIYVLSVRIEKQYVIRHYAIKVYKNIKNGRS